ncbi:MAG: cation:dicarboxylase symporter family transporter [Rectinema sp.]
MLFATMKLWLKYALGIIMGTILYIALPPSMVDGTPAISFLAELSLSIGGYALILTLAAGIPISVFRLSESHRFSTILSSGVVFFAVSLVVAAGLGLAAALIFRPAPLPLISGNGVMQTLSPFDLIRSIFPASIFSSFSGSATWFLPLALFMLAFGLALSHDPVMSRPLIPVLDVISRAAYLINAFISEILGILLIPISLYRLLELRDTGTLSEYKGILVYSASATIVFLLVIFPILYRVLGGKSNPYVLLYSMTGPLLATAASGSIFFSSGTALRHISESLGIKRNTNAVIFPLALLSGRIGSVFIVASSFIAMFLSYSRNIPGAGQILLLLIIVPFSVLVGAAGIRSDILVMISLTCILFGQGFQNGASLLVPVGLPLSICAAPLDGAWMVYSTALIAEHHGERTIKKARNFI